MGRSALASINLRGNQTLYIKLLAAGIATLISSKGLGANSELIRNLGRFPQGQGFFAKSGRTGCKKGWTLPGVSVASGGQSRFWRSRAELGLAACTVVKTEGLEPSA